MGKYSNFIYGDGTLYGETPKLGFSVEPMLLGINSFTKVTISWKAPQGFFTKIRLVRNQSGFPETAEDGLIVYEETSPDGTSLEGNVLTDFVDGVTNLPLLSGHEVYYRIFLFNAADKIWITSGSVHGVIPRNTGVTKKILDLLPRVITTKELSPLGPLDAVFSTTDGVVTDILDAEGVVIVTTNSNIEIRYDIPTMRPTVVLNERVTNGCLLATNSDLYSFIDGLAFTYEQLLTSIELTRPGHSTDKSVYLTIPGEDLHLGLPIQYNLPVVNQRRLIREALYLYSKRGTKSGLEGYAEALTGYIPTVTLSSNLFLTTQDSTFYNHPDIALDTNDWYTTTGNWHTQNYPNNLTATNEITPPTTEPLAIDTSWVAQFITDGSDTIEYGTYTDILGNFISGIPVNEDTEYTFSYYIKALSGGGTTSVNIAYYDKTEELISSSGDSSSVTVTTSWQKVTSTITTPVGTTTVGFHIYVSSADTYYFDMMSFQLGATAFYEEARAVNLSLLPRKQNYIHNPSFEVDTSTWNVTGATFTQDASVPLDGYSGDYSGKFVAAGTWTVETDYPVIVDLGSYFTLSAYAKSDDLTEVTFTVNTYDADDVLQNTYEDTLAITSDWTRVSLSGLIPSESTETYAICSIGGAAGTVYLDMVQFEDTSSPTDYFDGSMPGQYGTIWEGAAHASNSYLYPTKPTKIARLAHTMNEWVPLNIFWKITTPAGLEYTNLDV